MKDFGSQSADLSPDLLLQTIRDMSQMKNILTLKVAARSSKAQSYMELTSIIWEARRVVHGEWLS